MGWVAYEATKSSGGKMILYFPKVEAPIRLIDSGQGGPIYLDDLLKYPDFPIEANVIVRSDRAETVKQFGFPKVLSSELNGETLTINNGSRLVFREDTNGNFFVDYYRSDGTKLGTAASRQESGAFGFYTLPCFVGADKEMLIPERFYMNNRGNSFSVVTYTQYPERTGYYPAWPTNEYITDLNFFSGSVPLYITTDPYGDAGATETGGGTGDFDNTGDDVDIPALPTLSATSAGFITLFNPSVSELNNLASYMWSDLFDINGWKKVFADPMQAILGLSIVPVNVPAATAKPVKVGNISTDVSMTVAASQYVTVDCGTLNVNEFWGAYLDYDPFTKAEIYLPYIGIHSLATDDIMGKSVHVVYHVDILSGSCCAYVKCGGSVLYSFVGQCSASIPITGDNWTNVINGALSIAGSIGSMVATGGASAPSAIGNIASSAVNSVKPSIEKSGSMGGTGGMLGIQTPYLILTRPRQAAPRDQNKYIGYPSFITAKLSDLSGYTEIDSIHLDNIGATEKELSEIENILKLGVIF